MTPEAALTHAKARFRYTAEPGDRWQLADLDAAEVRGDCEDYALYLLALIAGSNRRAVWWLLTGRAAIWLVRTRSGGHAVLEYDKEFSDNRFPAWKNSLDGMALLPSERTWLRRLTKGRRRFSRFEIVVKLAMGRIGRRGA